MKYLYFYLILLPVLFSAPGYSQSYSEEDLITHRGRVSIERPNLYDRNQQRLRSEGRYISPGSRSNYYYQQDSDTFFYQTPSQNNWIPSNNDFVPFDDYSR